MLSHPRFLGRDDPSAPTGNTGMGVLIEFPRRDISTSLWGDALNLGEDQQVIEKVMSCIEAAKAEGDFPEEPGVRDVIGLTLAVVGGMIECAMETATHPIAQALDTLRQTILP